MSALDALLTGLVDFAGLFPPAGLDMRSAVRAYDAYRNGAHARMLGSFVVPAARLDEFESELAALRGAADEGRAWPVSVITGDPIEAEIARALRPTPPGGRGPAAQTVSIEARALSARDVDRLLSIASPMTTAAIEIPWSLARDSRRPVLSAVKAAGWTAKLRTGGVTVDAIPSPRQVAEFIWDCACAGVPFKATAGLHHAVRAEHPLRYDAESPRAVMHGFINVFLAAAVAWKTARSSPSRGAEDPPEAVTEILDERDPSSFALDVEAIRWRGLDLPAADIAGARGAMARSFGSCSFVEPVSDLEALGWLSHP